RVAPAHCSEYCRGTCTGTLLPNRVIGSLTRAQRPAFLSRCSIPAATPTMTTLELTDHDKPALAAVLRATIAADRHPPSPRVQRLRAILERLEPPPARPQPLAPPRRIGEPTYVPP